MPREFKQAKAARKLYHIVGPPTVENFKKQLQTNMQLGIVPSLLKMWRSGMHFWTIYVCPEREAD